jgi:hypothetical protein
MSSYVTKNDFSSKCVILNFTAKWHSCVSQKLWDQGPGQDCEFVRFRNGVHEVAVFFFWDVTFRQIPQERLPQE